MAESAAAVADGCDDIINKFEELSIGSGSQANDAELQTTDRVVNLEEASTDTVEECWKNACIEVSKAQEQQTECFKLNLQPEKLQFLVKYKAAALDKILRKSEFVLNQNQSTEHLTVSTSSKTDLERRVKSADECLILVAELIHTKDVKVQESKLLLIKDDLLSEVRKHGIDKRTAQVMKKSNDSYCIIGEDDKKVELVHTLLEGYTRDVTVVKLEEKELFENLDIHGYLVREFPKLKILLAEDSTHVIVGMKGEKKEALRSASVLGKIKKLEPDTLGHVKEEIEKDIFHFLAKGNVRSRINDYLRKKTLKLHWNLSREETICYLDFFVLLGEDQKKCVECFLKEIIPEVQKTLEMEQQENQIFKCVLPMPFGFQKYLTTNLQEELRILKSEFSVSFSERSDGITLEASSIEKMESAKKAIFALKKRVCHTDKDLKVRKGFTYKQMKNEVEKLEKEFKCTITFFKSGTKELQYHTCWNASRQCLTVAEGDIENAVCDAVVCMIDDNCQPVGESTIQIFRKGGWNVLEDDAIKLKKEANVSTSSRCVYSSSDITTLNCRTVLYIHAKNLDENLGRVWKEINDDQNRNQWSRVCFPADFPPFSDVSLKELLNVFLQSEMTLKKRVEVLLCVRRQENLAHTMKIWEDFNRGKSFWVDFADVNLMKGKICSRSPIKMTPVKGSLIDIAKEGKVDVIVNSSNLELNLSEGYISKEILKYGGDSIKNECSTDYSNGICYGEIAFTTGGHLPCMICHGALYPKWIYDGNFSLKILSAFVKRCLKHTEAKLMTSIAFPALGTGKLGYPYLKVARTMVRAVNDYGRCFPETIIQSVHFILQSSEKECFEAFENALRTDSYQQANQGKIEDMFSIQDFLLLDTRIQEHDLLIQLMKEDASAYTDEPAEARLRFYTDTSRYKGRGSEVEFSWSVEKGCYTREMRVSEKKSRDHIKDMAKSSFQLLEKRRITSVLIDVTDCTEVGISHALYEAFKEFVPTICLSGSMSASVKLRRYLRVLQIMVNKTEFSQLLGEIDGKPTENDHGRTLKFLNWIWKEKVLYKKSSKRIERDIECCIFGADEDSKEKTVGELQRCFERRVKTGHWCACIQEGQLILLSSRTNAILIEAEENGEQYVEIGMGYPVAYNLEEGLRTHKEGDRRSEKMVWIQGDCDVPEQLQTPVWCVLAQQNDALRFLNPEVNKILNNIADQRGTEASIADVDGIMYNYDLNRMERQDRDKKFKPEKIFHITGFEDNNHTRNNFQIPADQVQLVPDKNEDDLQIFEYVTGFILYQEMADEEMKEKIRKKATVAGCQVTDRKRSNSFFIKGSLTQVLEVNKQLTAVEERPTSSESMEYIITIPMSDRDFKVFSHFGEKCHWFKQARKKMLHDDHNLTCTVSADEGEILEKNMKEHVDKIRMMNTDQIVLADNRGVNIHQIMQDVEREYPNVCLLLKDSNVEIICDSYTDLLKIKGLLQQKMSGKVNRRAFRKFAKAEEGEETLPAGDTYRRRFNTDGNFQTEFQSDGAGRTMPQIKFESKTEEGLKIKIYEGSITRLDVECIVNAANENLMHGGGVAAAISEAAGDVFDDESKDYIATHGPIPVARCAVTSAGKLPYKHVIHTVGPRWSAYTDKDRCLNDLCESVEVTFRKADKLGMASIALPAISSGIFGIPRDKCVEQYYKAVMTFSRSYPFQSLKEIHFVDRDASMVSAIQAVFQQEASSTSCLDTTGSPEAPGNGKTLSADNSKSSSIHQSSQLNKQPTTADSIIKVSDMLTIKVHLGNITDVTADIVVCPQDEYCSSKGQVARGILKLIPSESEAPCAGRKKIGQIMSQKIYGNSPWKMIIHAVTPRWNSKSAKDPGTFERTLNIMIQGIIKNADDSKYLSIAVPLLGAGVDDYLTPMETCARNFYKAVKAVHSKLIYLKEIYLVVKEEAAEKVYLDTFEDGGFQVMPKTISESFQSGSKADWGKTIKSSDLSQEQENCCICMDTPTNPKRLKKCGHIFCKECIEQYFEYKPACPSCGQIYGKMMGDQPPGSISINKSHQRLEGFNDCHNCIIVTYTFNSGSQGSEHPNPGKWYKGISRSGYVPNNGKGRLVAKLLNVAFSRQLVFTIGRSRTTGQDGVITWNDIHHKTRPDGGPQKFGYPDNTYLDRVLEELAAKGVTPESADDPEEYSEYSKFVRYN